MDGTSVLDGWLACLLVFVAVLLAWVSLEEELKVLLGKHDVM